MKHFEPILIQEETDVRHELFIRPAIDKDEFIDIVLIDGRRERIGITQQAATRLRDALNTILND